MILSSTISMLIWIYLLQVEKNSAIHIYFDMSSAKSFAPLIYKLRLNTWRFVLILISVNR